MVCQDCDDGRDASQDSPRGAVEVCLSKNPALQVPQAEGCVVRVDYLIVGSGLTGAVIARTLADAGREVLAVDRRNHMGGNVHDHAHSSGIPFASTPTGLTISARRATAFGSGRIVLDHSFDTKPHCYQPRMATLCRGRLASPMSAKRSATHGRRSFRDLRPILKKPRCR
ncbi:FAD-binding protein [bacterium]|nr:FAD-binding protein [bacterium]